MLAACGDNIAKLFRACFSGISYVKAVPEVVGDGTLSFWMWALGALRKGPLFHGSRSFKGDKSSECKLSNGLSRSYREMKMLLSARNEWSWSYREINQHPNLPWNFITHGFMDPSAFPDKCHGFLVATFLSVFHMTPAKISLKTSPPSQ